MSAAKSTPPAAPKQDPAAGASTTPTSGQPSTSGSPGDRPTTYTEPQTPGQDATPANPAGAAIQDAARAAEVEQLRRERDELRELIGEAPELAVLRAEVDALRQAAARSGVTRTARWNMSAGVAADLEMRGYAVDPATGDAYVRNGDQVTVTSRTGETRTVDMPTPVSPTAAAHTADGK